MRVRNIGEFRLDILKTVLFFTFTSLIYFSGNVTSVAADDATIIFKESWNKSNKTIYTPKYTSLSPIKGDEGSWYIDATVDGEPLPDGCGPTPHKAEIIEEDGNKKLKLISSNSSSGCSDNVWVWWDRQYSGNSKKIPITPKTRISFKETGKMLGSPEDNSGWGSDNCGLGLPCGVSLILLDNNGTGVIYRLQYPTDAEDDLEATFIKILLDSDAGSYSRNLFDDFMEIPNFNPSGAYVTEIIFEIEPWDDSTNMLGWGIIDDIVISESGDQTDPSAIDDDGDGYTENQGDCNDNNEAIYPGAIEICDAKDNNCDGSIDEGSVCQICTDSDGDGYYSESGCGNEVDCNDNDKSTFPGAIEILDDGIDQNCDGQDETIVDGPIASRGLAVNAVSYRKILLRWTDKSDDEDGFKIERKKKYCSDETYNWSQIAIVSGDNKYEDVDNFDLGIKYSYRVRAYKGLGNSEYSNCGVTTTASATGTPSAPVNLVVTCASSSKVDLSWDEWSSNVTEFKIYREVNDSDSWTLLATTGPATLNYSDTTASGNQSSTGYCYYVQACNDKGCSPPTYKVCIPFNPSNLTATAGSGKIILNWQDNSDNERGFELYRKTGNCSSSASWEKVKSAGIDRTTVSDKKDLVSGSTYSYKIRAYCRSWGLPYVYGYSDWSDCAFVTAP